MGYDPYAILILDGKRQQISTLENGDDLGINPRWDKNKDTRVFELLDTSLDNLLIVKLMDNEGNMEEHQLIGQG
jgi:hypothetical protein